MSLLVDIGNTRLKWGISIDGNIDVGQSLFIDNLDDRALFEFWHNLPPPHNMAIACVGVTEHLTTVINAAKGLWSNISVVVAQSQAEFLGIKNAYPQPLALGVDRWLAIVAVYQEYQSALCVVSCGTATTIDCIDPYGQHLGGIICPGIRLMKQSLADNTANLPITEGIAYPVGLSNETTAAIHSGVLLAIAGLIERTVKNQNNGLNLILTGGDAELIATSLSLPFIIDPNLVLKGLALLLKN